MTFHQNYYFKNGEKRKVSFAPFKNTSFTAIDIGSPSKGPLFTLVKGDGRALSHNLVGCKLRMNYYIEDTPIDEAVSFDTYADFMLSADPHELYPLILQILHINEFLENQADDDHRIFLDQIYIQGKISNEVLTGEFTDKQIRKAIEKFGVMTDVNSIVEKESFIYVNHMKNGMIYEILEDVPSDTTFGDNIFKCYPGIETCFMVQSNILITLMQLDMVTITVTNEEKVEKMDQLSPLSSLFEKRNIHSVRTYRAVTIDDIFKLILYVPQITRIERVLYDVDTTMKITIEKRGKSVSLTITRDEYHINFDLFNTICAMLHLLRY